MCRRRRHRYPDRANSRDGTGRDGTGRDGTGRDGTSSPGSTRARAMRLHEAYYHARETHRKRRVRTFGSRVVEPDPNRNARARAVHRPLIDSLHALAHSLKQYSRLRNDSLNTNGSRRTLAGPNPGPPPPPRAHVAKHLLAHFSIALPFGPDVSRRRLGRARELTDSLARRPSGTSSM